MVKVLFAWIFDPIDGTKSFISGVPLYSTLVGLECESQPALGVIHLPALQCRVYALKDHGAFQFDPSGERKATVIQL